MGGSRSRVKLQLFKKPFPCLAHCAWDRGVWGEVGGHAESSFLLPVRTLSGIQPELINSNRPPHYPGCNGPQAGGWPVGNSPPPPPELHPHTTTTSTTTTPPHTHTQTLHTPPARAAHTTLPLFHTEAIINTCNNIFTASNSLLQIRASRSCGVHSCTHGHPRTYIHTQTYTQFPRHAHVTPRCF